MLHSKYIQRILPEVKVIHASDGEEAFHLAQVVQPVLIITDQGMPNVDGFELLKKLKEDPSTQNIPIIFVTGHYSHAVQENLNILGVSEIINKPVSQENLEIALLRIGIIKKGENEKQVPSNIS